MAGEEMLRKMTERQVKNEEPRHPQGIRAETAS